MSRPPHYHSVTPYLTVTGIPELIAFLTHAFNAAEEEKGRQLRADGSVWHTVVRIGDSLIEMSEPSGDYPAQPSALHVYVDDTDLTYQQALAAGATSLYEPADMDYGERSAGVRDRSGNQWYIATYQGQGTTATP